MQEPQITTIIPTYRRPKMLRRAIRSVLAQTYPHFEVMVLDNASGDETPDVVAELARQDSRVKYHCHPENTGAFANFDYGMRRVETPFFYFLCDDNVALPHFYETVMKGFQEHPSAMFSSGATVNVAIPGRILGAPTAAWAPGRYDPPKGCLKMLTEGSPSWTGTLFRREVMQAVGYLDRQVGLSSDLDFSARIAARFPFVMSSRPCAFAVTHPSSCSELSGLALHWPGMLKTIHNVADDPRVDGGARERLRALLYASLVRGLFRTAHRCLRQRRFRESLKIGAVLRKCLGKTMLGSLVQVAALVAEGVPLFASLLDARLRVKLYVTRNSAVRRLAKLGWEGLDEARRYLDELKLTG